LRQQIGSIIWNRHTQIRQETYLDTDIYNANKQTAFSGYSYNTILSGPELTKWYKTNTHRKWSFVRK